MRRFVASVVLLTLVALSAVPLRLPAWFDSLWQSSTLSEQAPKDSGVCDAHRAAPLRVAPPPLRAELACLPPPTPGWPLARRVQGFGSSQLSPRAWLMDQRESIRRVCRRVAPPDSAPHPSSA
ncbi:MAG: hypothetical protein IPI67_23065 [Myxococcales bacterium]|nr:hypothetical protein [Myxococcales bacterium]